MTRFSIRIVAFLLVPCLLAEPSASFALSVTPWPRSHGVTFDEFKCEALAAKPAQAFIAQPSVRIRLREGRFYRVRAKLLYWNFKVNRRIWLSPWFWSDRVYGRLPTFMQYPLFHLKKWASQRVVDSLRRAAVRGLPDAYEEIFERGKYLDQIEAIQHLADECLRLSSVSEDVSRVFEIAISMGQSVQIRHAGIRAIGNLAHLLSPEDRHSREGLLTSIAQSIASFPDQPEMFLLDPIRHALDQLQSADQSSAAPGPYSPRTGAVRAAPTRERVGAPDPRYISRSWHLVTPELDERGHVNFKISKMGVALYKAVLSFSIGVAFLDQVLRIYANLLLGSPTNYLRARDVVPRIKLFGNFWFINNFTHISIAQFLGKFSYWPFALLFILPILIVLIRESVIMRYLKSVNGDLYRRHELQFKAEVDIAMAFFMPALLSTLLAYLTTYGLDFGNDYLFYAGLRHPYIFNLSDALAGLGFLVMLIFGFIRVAPLSLRILFGKIRPISPAQTPQALRDAA